MSDTILGMIFIISGFVLAPAGFILLLNLAPPERPPGVQFSEPPLRFLAVLLAYGLMLFGVSSVGVGLFIAASGPH